MAESLLLSIRSKAVTLNMPYELILQNIAKHISLDKEEADHFVSLLTKQDIPKKQLILKEGQLCRSISFVDSGILRAYHLDKDGRESTIMFALSDWWITDMYCFINRLPAMLNIETIEDSTSFNCRKLTWMNYTLKCRSLKGFSASSCRTHI
jgi:CRP-like cAMP-binding protein